MNAHKNNLIITIGAGIILLLASLPCTWMTIENATLNTPGFPSGAGVPNLEGLTVAAKGFNGTITLLGIKLPIWLVVTIGLVSLLLILLNQTGVSAIPKGVILVPLLISVLFVLFGLIVGLSSDKASAGIGGLLALLGLGIGGWPAFQRTQKNRSSETQGIS